MESVRKTLTELPIPIAAICIEPTQHSTGYSVSDSFIDNLANIADDFNAALIVDECNTCCGASGGSFFKYQGGKADYVVFGNRMQASGYFSKSEGLSLAGNENDVRLFQTIYETIQQDSLLDKV